MVGASPIYYLISGARKARGSGAIHGMDRMARLRLSCQ